MTQSNPNIESRQVSWWSSMRSNTEMQVILFIFRCFCKNIGPIHLNSKIKHKRCLCDICPSNHCLLQIDKVLEEYTNDNRQLMEARRRSGDQVAALLAKVLNCKRYIHLSLEFI